MALNLRTITPDLHQRLKLAAFSSGKALERFCLDVLESAVEPTSNGDSISPGSPTFGKGKRVRIPPVDESPRPVGTGGVAAGKDRQTTKACKECGSLGGGHQKWCKA